MNNDQPEARTGTIDALLAACDEALAVSDTPLLVESGNASPELRSRLERGVACIKLLREMLLPPQTPQTPDTPVATDAPPAAPLPSSLGRFQIRRELGHVAFGIVFLAYDPHLRRDVALKVPRAEALVSPQARERFLREARAAAGLEHPNVVPVYEAGEAGSVCYIASAYCPGTTLAQWLRQRDEPVPARQAATLVATLADGVEHAHNRHVVHRDLKPANVLLENTGGDKATLDLTPRIADFGLAKLVEGERPEASATGAQTESGAIVGTPCYMAPEQAGGHSREVGPAADVYALGSILYEVLTGRPPFQGETVLDVLLQVRTEEPVPPGSLRARLPRDLETICLKCLEKTPARRYATAQALADDLRRFLADEPVQARPVGRPERLWRWCRRNPVVAGLLATVAATLLVGAMVATLFGLAANAEARHAEEAAGKAQDNERWALEQKREAEAARTQAEKDRTRANDEARKAREQEEQKDRQLTRAEWLVYAGQLDRAQQAWREGDARVARDLLDSARWDYRDWEHRYLHTLFNTSHLTFLGHTGWVSSVTFSPDGKRIASGSQDRTVKVWDAQTGHELLTIKGHTDWAPGVAFSPDGTRLASASFDRTVKVWDAQSGRQLLDLKGHTNRVTSVAFSPDGRRLASGSDDHTLKLWDAQTGRQTLDLKGHTSDVTSVAFSPDGTRLASGSADQTVKVWDAQTGRQALELSTHTAPVVTVAFSPDGTRLASGSLDHTVKVWDAHSGQQLLDLKPHAGVFGVAFSPDGRRLAGSASDWAVKVWDVQTGRQALELKGHTGFVYSVAFSPDGTRLASGSLDLTVKVWDAQSGQQIPTLKGHTGWMTSVAFSPDGGRLAGGSTDQTVKVWDAQTGQQTLELKGHTDNVSSVAFSPDGRRIASGSGSPFRLGQRRKPGEVKVWDAQTGQQTLELKGHTDNVSSVAFSPDGKRLACGSGGRDAQGRVLPGEAKVWDAHSGREVLTLKGHTGAVLSVAFSPDSRRLASGSSDKTVKVWDAQTGQQLLALKGHEYAVNSVAFSPDGKHVASGSGGGYAQPGEVKVWDVSMSTEGRQTGGQQTLSLQGHTLAVTSVAFSPDGKRIASGAKESYISGESGELKVWDAQTGRQTLELKGHTYGVTSVCFSPDGTRLAGGSEDEPVKVWEARCGQEVRPLKGHTDRVTGVAFRGDGTRVVAAGEKGEVRAWDARTGQEIVPCTDPPPPQQQQAASPDGQRLVRIVNGQPVVQPRILQPDDWFNRRLQDKARTHFWHLQMAQEARQTDDAFALAFHLRPLLLTALTRWQDRPPSLLPLLGLATPAKPRPGSGGRFPRHRPDRN
jgi:WD40 repeat protein